MPHFTGTTKNGKVISVKSMSPVKAEKFFVDYVDGYLINPVKDGDTYREATTEEIISINDAKVAESIANRSPSEKLRDNYCLDMIAEINADCVSAGVNLVIEVNESIQSVMQKSIIANVSSHPEILSKLLGLKEIVPTVLPTEKHVIE